MTCVDVQIDAEIQIFVCLVSAALEERSSCLHIESQALKPPMGADRTPHPNAALALNNEAASEPCVEILE